MVDATVATHALLSTFLISALPTLFLVLLPYFQKVNEKGNVIFSSRTLNILVGFAVGGLLGDSLLHLIPHALFPHNHNDHGHSHGHSHGHDHHHDDGHHHHDHHHHDHHHNSHHASTTNSIDAHAAQHSLSNTVGLLVLVGIALFFTIDRLTQVYRGDDHSGHGHSHGHVQHDIHNSKDIEKKQNKQEAGKEEEPEKLPASAILNLIADLSHNFTDGLAIAAAFSSGSSIGFSTMLAVLFHEVPHELGDYAILMQAGVSHAYAIKLQCITAVGAFAGTIVGLLCADVFGGIETIVLPITAGGFLYIALAGVVPSLATTKPYILRDTMESLVAASIGVGFMVIITWYE